MKFHRINAIVRLTRLPNLVIIALVLYLQRWCIVLPGLQKSGIEPGWTGYAFIVLGTVLLAASGYLINDYFDKEIDAVNQPAKAAVLRLMLPVTIRKAYVLVSIAGLVSIALACYLSGTAVLWPVYLFAAAILFWYSFRLKKVLILGNLAVAAASAFTMPAAWLYDLLPLSELDSFGFPTGNVYQGISENVIIYCLFAFLISFSREIIKDIEDIEGDRLYGCRTVPVVYGVPVAKGFALAGFLMIFILLFWWQADLLSTGQPGIAFYLAVALDLPLLWLSVYVIRIRTKRHFHFAGLMAKIIMVTGILSMLGFLF